MTPYPVGSVYISFSATDPAELFGGTWERIQGRFLLAASDIYAAGTTGGEATHTLTTTEMPTHHHGIQYSTDSTTIGQKWPLMGDGNGHTTTYGGYIAQNGSSQPHNNLPPYVVVYMWVRKA